MLFLIATIYLRAKDLIEEDSMMMLFLLAMCELVAELVILAYHL